MQLRDGHGRLSTRGRQAGPGRAGQADREPGGSAAIAVLFATDYAQGTSLYAAVASYHAYLEFPVLLMLVLGLGPRVPQGEK